MLASPEEFNLMLDEKLDGNVDPRTDDPAVNAPDCDIAPGVCINIPVVDPPNPPVAAVKLLKSPGSPGLGSPLSSCSIAVDESKR